MLVASMALSLTIPFQTILPCVGLWVSAWKRTVAPVNGSLIRGVPKPYREHASERNLRPEDKVSLFACRVSLSHPIGVTNVLRRGNVRLDGAWGCPAPTVPGIAIRPHDGHGTQGTIAMVADKMGERGIHLLSPRSGEIIFLYKMDVAGGMRFSCLRRLRFFRQEVRYGDPQESFTINRREPRNSTMFPKERLDAHFQSPLGKARAPVVRPALEGKRFSSQQCPVSSGMARQQIRSGYPFSGARIFIT